MMARLLLALVVSAAAVSSAHASCELSTVEGRTAAAHITHQEHSAPSKAPMCCVSVCASCAVPLLEAMSGPSLAVQTVSYVSTLRNFHGISVAPGLDPPRYNS